MKALVYHGPGQKSWEDVPDATIQDPTDVVVRVDTTTICGTDLHILHGDVAGRDRRPHPRSRSGRHDHRGRRRRQLLRGRRPGAGAGHHARAGGASTASATCPRTARPWAASAGSSGT